MITNIEFTEKAGQSYRKLPLHIKKKADRQLTQLIENPKHPSLRVKKKQGESIFEARIDYHFRFTFVIVDTVLWILTVGPHDEGLGKK